MININYRIYSSYGGWKLLGIEINIEDVIKILKDHIYTEHAQYIIIEHHNDQDMDIPFKSIASEKEFIEFKEEIKNVSTRNQRVYTKKKQ